MISVKLYKYRFIVRDLNAKIYRYLRPYSWNRWSILNKCNFVVSAVMNYYVLSPLPSTIWGLVKMKIVEFVTIVIFGIFFDCCIMTAKLKVELGTYSISKSLLRYVLNWYARNIISKEPCHTKLYLALYCTLDLWSLSSGAMRTGVPNWEIIKKNRNTTKQQNIE